MTTHIQINMMTGNAFADESDKQRAVEAAELVFQAAGADAFEAQTEYFRQLEEFDDEEPMTGFARIFVEARNAADIALTKSWANSTGASCTIEAWRN